MYEKILKTFVSGAGGKIGGRIVELFDEQAARMVRIEEKIDKIYDAVLDLRLRQRLLFFTHGKERILSDISIYRSYVNGTRTPSDEDLANISRRFIATHDSSFIHHINKFVTQIIGAELGDGIFRNTFAVEPSQFRKGALFEYADSVLCKDDLAIEDYVRGLSDFAAIFIYDLQKLSEAYSLAYQVLKRAGIMERADVKLDVEPRWHEVHGLANDLMPLLADCVRFIAGPALLLSEVSANRWHERPVSAVLKYDQWVLENKCGTVYSGYRADNSQPPTFGLSPNNKCHLWYLRRGASAEPNFISLAGGTDPSRMLTIGRGQSDGTSLRPPGTYSFGQSFRPKVHKSSAKGSLQWFKLSRSDGFDLVAGRTFANMLGLYSRVELYSSFMTLGAGDEFRRFAFIFWSDRLFSGEYLQAGQFLTNLDDAKYKLRFEPTLGLVVYEKDKSLGAIWEKPHNVKIDARWRMYVGLDGLHIYSGSQAYVDSPPRLAADDPARLAMLLMQDDGNVVMYDYEGDHYTTTAKVDGKRPINVILHA